VFILQKMWVVLIYALLYALFGISNDFTSQQIGFLSHKGCLNQIRLYLKNCGLKNTWGYHWRYTVRVSSVWVLSGNSDKPIGHCNHYTKGSFNTATFNIINMVNFWLVSESSDSIFFVNISISVLILGYSG
jgi:hypothetical protein